MNFFDNPFQSSGQEGSSIHISTGNHISTDNPYLRWCHLFSLARPHSKGRNRNLVGKEFQPVLSSTLLELLQPRQTSAFPASIPSETSTSTEPKEIDPYQEEEEEKKWIHQKKERVLDEFAKHWDRNMDKKLKETMHEIENSSNMREIQERHRREAETISQHVLPSLWETNAAKEASTHATTIHEHTGAPTESEPVCLDFPPFEIKKHPQDRYAIVFFANPHGRVKADYPVIRIEGTASSIEEATEILNQNRYPSYHRPIIIPISSYYPLTQHPSDYAKSRKVMDLTQEEYVGTLDMGDGGGIEVIKRSEYLHNILNGVREDAEISKRMELLQREHQRKLSQQQTLEVQKKKNLDFKIKKVMEDRWNPAEEALAIFQENPDKEAPWKHAIEKSQEVLSTLISESFLREQEEEQRKRYQELQQSHYFQQKKMREQILKQRQQNGASSSE